MKTRYADEMLWVRAGRGHPRQLFAYAEPLKHDAPAAHEEPIRWARDEQGRWYSFSRFGDAVVESLTGTWFRILGKAG